MKQNEHFIAIPYRVLGRNLPDKAKMLYGFIDGFNYGDCIASNEYMAGILNTSSRNIQKLLSQLIEQGFVYRKLIYENNECVGRVLNINTKK